MNKRIPMAFIASVIAMQVVAVPSFAKTEIKQVNKSTINQKSKSTVSDLKSSATSKTAPTDQAKQVKSKLYQGGSYTGLWLNNKPEGKGSWTWKNADGEKETQTGFWSKGILSGQAKIENASYIYAGNVKKGKLTGKGVLKYHEGLIMTGQFDNGTLRYGTLSEKGSSVQYEMSVSDLGEQEIFSKTESDELPDGAVVYARTGEYEAFAEVKYQDGIHSYTGPMELEISRDSVFPELSMEAGEVTISGDTLGNYYKWSMQGEWIDDMEWFEGDVEFLNRKDASTVNTNEFAYQNGLFYSVDDVEKSEPLSAQDVLVILLNPDDSSSEEVTEDVMEEDAFLVVEDQEEESDEDDVSYLIDDVRFENMEKTGAKVNYHSAKD